MWCHDCELVIGSETAAPAHDSTLNDNQFKITTAISGAFLLHLCVCVCVCVQ